MDTIGRAEAKARLSELVDRAEAGESIDITRRGKTVARLTAVARPRKRIDLAALRAPTAPLPPQDRDAADLVDDAEGDAGLQPARPGLRSVRARRPRTFRFPS